MIKQISYLIFLFSLPNRSFEATLDRDQGGCQDGSANGAITEHGLFYFQCVDGRISPKGCINDQRKHVDIGQTTDRYNYRLKCVLNGQLMQLEPASCLYEGSAHEIDEIFDSGSNFLVCKRNGERLQLITLGCVDGGRRLNRNEQIVKDDFVFQCNDAVNEGARLEPVACVKDGRRYNVGETFEIDKSWFTCTRVGREKLAAKVGGCVVNGKRLKDGDRFNENEVFYECFVDANKNDVRAMSCAQKDESGSVVERPIGCTWFEGNAPYQYETTCQIDSSTNLPKKVALRCGYNAGGGQYNLDPGCYRVIDNAAFGCIRDGSSLNLQSYQGDNAESAAKSAGLRSC